MGATSRARRRFFIVSGSVLFAVFFFVGVKVLVSMLTQPKPGSKHTTPSPLALHGGMVDAETESRQTLPRLRFYYKESLPSTVKVWGRQQVGRLNLELPGEARITAFTVPTALRETCDKSEQHTLQYGSSTISISYLRYKQVSADLDAAATSTLRGLRNRAGISDFTSDYIDMNMAGNAARKVTARFLLAGEELANHTLIVTRGNAVWTVGVTGPPADVPALADRILASLSVGH